MTVVIVKSVNVYMVEQVDMIPYNGKKNVN